MGRRGPRPKPTALIRAGSCSWRGHRNRHEPRPPAGNPPCPKWLDPEAKKMWRRVLRHLQAVNLLTPLDGNILARYCESWVRYKRAVLFLRQYGETYRINRPDGTLACLLPFPQAVMASKLSAELLRMEQELGFSPSARSRIVVYPGMAPKSPEERERDAELRKLFEGGGPAKPRRARRSPDDPGPRREVFAERGRESRAPPESPPNPQRDGPPEHRGDALTA